MIVPLIKLHENSNAIADCAKKKGASLNTINKLRTAKNNIEVFDAMLVNYGWYQNNSIIIPELESLTREKLSPLWVWILETYHLGTEVDNVVLPIIELHKRIIAGESVSEKEWFNSRFQLQETNNKAWNDTAWVVKSATEMNAIFGISRYVNSEAVLSKWQNSVEKFYNYILSISSETNGEIKP